MKKYSVLLLVLVLISTLLLGGCGKTEVSVPEPEWSTVQDSAGGFSYQIPEGWVITEDVTGQGSVIYIPGDADSSAGVSNVNLVMVETGAEAVAFEDLKAALEQDLAPQLLANGFSAVENISVREMEAPIGKVCAISYDAELTGVTFSQTQFYPLIDNYSFVVTATDIGDGVTPNVAEVAEYIVMTLELDA